jgi:hypothetical protein
MRLDICPFVASTMENRHVMWRWCEHAATEGLADVRDDDVQRGVWRPSARETRGASTSSQLTFAMTARRVGDGNGCSLPSVLYPGVPRPSRDSCRAYGHSRSETVSALLLRSGWARTATAIQSRPRRPLLTATVEMTRFQDFALPRFAENVLGAVILTD